MGSGLNIIFSGEKRSKWQCSQRMKTSKQKEKVEIYLNANDDYVIMTILNNSFTLVLNF